MVLTKNSALLLLDVGGTFIKSTVVNSAREILPSSEFTFPIHSEGTVEEILSSLETVCRHGMATIQEENYVFAGIGVAIPGPFNYESGVFLMKHKFQSVYGVSLRSVFQKICGVGPSFPIWFMHDVNAVLSGEMLCGGAVGYHNVAVVTLGTGLGFSYAVDGKIQVNALGSPQSPIYNLPFQSGILEDYASKRGFLRIYSESVGHDLGTMTVADIGHLAQEGDSIAMATFATVGSYISEAVQDILCENHIEALLFGGQISRSFAFMKDAVARGLQSVITLEKIDAVSHIGDAVFYGLMRLNGNDR